jgi:hypothetical protein
MEDRNVETQELMDLGIMIGQRRAFGMVAGRCTAAQAECLRKVREEKLYLKCSPNWDDYCTQHLKMTKRAADRTIAQLKELGPLYFEAAALTGISPAEFRRVRDSIQKDGIQVGAEVIALIPENAERAVSAIAQLLAQAIAAEPAKAAPSPQQQIADLQRRGTQLCESFHQTARIAGPIERQWLIGAIKKLQAMFNRLEGEIT